MIDRLLLHCSLYAEGGYSSEKRCAVDNILGCVFRRAQALFCLGNDDLTASTMLINSARVVICVLVAFRECHMDSDCCSISA